MRPGEILDAQADLIERLDHEVFKGYLGAMSGVTQELGPERAREVAEQMADALKRLTQASYAYRVTPDMCQLVRFAASQLDDSDAWDRDLAPTQCGFVRFDDPLPVRDVRGRTMLINWLVWGPLSKALDDMSGVSLWQFNDAWTHPDDLHRDFWDYGNTQEFTAESLERLARVIGRWETVGTDIVQDGRPLGPENQEPGPEQAAALAAEGVEAVPGTNVLRLVHALWLLLGQTVTVVEDEAVDRPARRRATRKNLPPKVTVIRLRRAEGHARREGESHVEWQHRWIVRGHWRWQACGPNRSERRRIWIHPFVKGPEGAPLKQSEKVYSLDR